MSHRTTSGGGRRMRARYASGATVARGARHAAQRRAEVDAAAPARGTRPAHRAFRQRQASARASIAFTCASSSDVIVAKSFFCRTSRGEKLNAASSLDLVAVRRVEARLRLDHRLGEPGHDSRAPGRPLRCGRAREARAPPPSSRGACGFFQKRSNACSKRSRCSRRETSTAASASRKSVRLLTPTASTAASASITFAGPTGNPAARSRRTKCRTFSARKPRGRSVGAAVIRAPGP